MVLMLACKTSVQVKAGVPKKCVKGVCCIQAFFINLPVLNMTKTLLKGQ